MTADQLLLVDYSLFAAALIALSWWAVSSHRPALAMFAAFCIVYLVARPLMLLTGLYGRFLGLQGESMRFDPESLWRVLAFTAAITAIAIVTYLLARGGSLERVVCNGVAQVAQRPALVAVIWIAAFGVFVVSAGFSVGSSLFGVLLFGLLWLIGYGRDARRKWYWIGGGLALLAVALAFTVERRDWAVAVFAVGWLLMLDRARSFFIKVIAGGVLLAVVAAAAVALRSESNVGDRLQGGGDVVLAIVEIELDFPLVFDDLALLFSKVPDEQPFLYGEVAVKPLIAWIPRAAWPEKPQTLSREFSRRFNRHFYATDGSEPLTFAGELYWNFGWFGLAFGPALGWLLAVLDRAYLIGRNWRGLDPLRGTAVVAGPLVMASMSFYVLRGPIDTFWIHYVVLIAAAVLVIAVPRAAAGAAPRTP